MAQWYDERFELITSESLVAELVEVLSRPHIASRIDQHRKLTLLRRLRHDAVWATAVDEATGATPDPGDDMLVGAALDARADVIVTWDNALLEHGTSSGVRFVSPDEFISILRRT